MWRVALQIEHDSRVGKRTEMLMWRSVLGIFEVLLFFRTPKRWRCAWFRLIALFYDSDCSKEKALSILVTDFEGGGIPLSGQGQRRLKYLWTWLQIKRNAKNTYNWVALCRPPIQDLSTCWLTEMEGRRSDLCCFVFEKFTTVFCFWSSNRPCRSFFVWSVRRLNFVFFFSLQWCQYRSNRQQNRTGNGKCFNFLISLQGARFSDFARVSFENLASCWYRSCALERNVLMNFAQNHLLNISGPSQKSLDVRGQGRGGSLEGTNQRTPGKEQSAGIRKQYSESQCNPRNSAETPTKQPTATAAAAVKLLSRPKMEANGSFNVTGNCCLVRGYPKRTWQQPCLSDSVSKRLMFGCGGYGY